MRIHIWSLAEIVSTIQIDSISLNELSQAVRDTVQQKVSAGIRGGQVVKETTMSEFAGNDIEKAGKVEVIMRLPLSGSGSVIGTIMPTLRPEIIKRTDESGVKLSPSPGRPFCSSSSATAKSTATALPLHVTDTGPSWLSSRYALARFDVGD